MVIRIVIVHQAKMETEPKTKNEKNVQMLPRLQGENFISFVSATGLMMNCALASQELPEKGQHCAELVPVAQPSAHYIMPPSVSISWA